MFPIINVGPFAIATSPLLLFLGIFSGIYLMNLSAKKLSNSSNRIENLILISGTGGMIAARFGFVIRYWQSFTHNILLVFKLSVTMLDLEFGIICAILIGLIYAQKKMIFVWETLDNLSIVIITFLPFYYLSQFASGKSLGTISSLPWSVVLSGTARHPVQIYLAVVSVIILLLFLISTKVLNKRMFPQDGYQLLFLATLTAFSSIVLDGFYAENKVIFQTIHLNQFVALLIILISFTIFLYRTKIKVTPKIIKFSDGVKNGD